MNSHFWQTLPTPIIGLSPMDGITDQPFRHITKKYGRPDLVYTEFTSVEGVCHGATQLLKDFLFDESQRPIIGQIYGTSPHFFRQTAVILCQLGFDGIDINMGCPAKNVAHSGAGAALIRTPQLAQEIIKATYQGIKEWQDGKTCQDCPDLVPAICAEVERRHQLLPTPYQQPRPIPVSVKTRVGYDTKIATDWIPYLLEMQPAAIAIHGRTLKQQYGGLADWEQIGAAAQVAATTDTLILGNGDIKTLADAHQRVTEYGVDGVLIGRASMGNPWVFLPEQSPTDRFQVALEHTRLFEATYRDDPKFNFLQMRKHLGWYIREIPNAAQVRSEIFQTNTSHEVENIFKKYGLV